MKNLWFFAREMFHQIYSFFHTSASSGTVMSSSDTSTSPEMSLGSSRSRVRRRFCCAKTPSQFAASAEQKFQRIEEQPAMAAALALSLMPPILVPVLCWSARNRSGLQA